MYVFFAFPPFLFLYYEFYTMEERERIMSLGSNIVFQKSTSFLIESYVSFNRYKCRRELRKKEKGCLKNYVKRMLYFSNIYKLISKAEYEIKKENKNIVKNFARIASYKNSDGVPKDLQNIILSFGAIISPERFERKIFDVIVGEMLRTVKVYRDIGSSEEQILVRVYQILTKIYVSYEGKINFFNINICHKDKRVFVSYTNGKGYTVNFGTLFYKMDMDRKNALYGTGVIYKAERNNKNGAESVIKVTKILEESYMPFF